MPMQWCVDHMPPPSLSCNPDSPPAGSVSVRIQTCSSVSHPGKQNFPFQIQPHFCVHRTSPQSHSLIHEPSLLCFPSPFLPEVALVSHCRLPFWQIQQLLFCAHLISGLYFWSTCDPLKFQRKTQDGYQTLPPPPQWDLSATLSPAVGSFFSFPGVVFPLDSGVSLTPAQFRAQPRVWGQFICTFGGSPLMFPSYYDSPPQHPAILTASFLSWFLKRTKVVSALCGLRGNHANTDFTQCVPFFQRLHPFPFLPAFRCSPAPSTVAFCVLSRVYTCRLWETEVDNMQFHYYQNQNFQSIFLLLTTCILSFLCWNASVALF